MMKKIGWVLVAVATAMLSGCALVGRHSAATDRGRRVTVGLFALDDVGDGYPFLPFYSSFDVGEK